MSSQVKFIMNYTIELLTAGLLALGSFALLFWLLNTFIQIGPGLQSIINDDNLSAMVSSQQDSNLRVSSQSYNTDLAENFESVAVLTAVLKNVKRKSAEKLSWKKADEGTPLQGGDSIQTFDGASASILFNEASQLHLDENSLIVISSLEEDIIWKEKKSYMVVIRGTLRGKIIPQDKNPVYVQIATPGSVTQLRSTSKETPVDFKIKINPDKSSTISVYEGVANVSTKDGKTISVEKNETSLISLEGEVSTPPLTPNIPELNSPKNNDYFYFKDAAPTISFEWHASLYSEEYRFLLSQDKKFEQIIHDKITKKNKLNISNLKSGTYYWKVSGISNNKVESPTSDRRGFVVIRDSKPPKLTLDFPTAKPGQKEYTLSGKTEASTTIYINGKKISSRSGRFSHTLELKNGPNIIVVESIDQWGNVTYKSEMIHGKY